MVVKSSIIVTFIAVCALCDLAFCDPVGYTETFTSDNADWQTDEDFDDSLFASYGGVSWDSGSKFVYAPYPAVEEDLTKTTAIFADATSSTPDGILAGNVNYSSAKGLIVSLKLSTDAVVPSVCFFLASNANSSSSTLSTSSAIFYAVTGADQNQLGTTWSQYTYNFTQTWRRLRGSASFSESLADVDAIGVMMADFGHTEYDLYVDNFTVTPEPGALLMMAPMAGFLGWKVVRRKRPSAPRVV
jgi:hypothetical protein